jgi:ABC-type lipoprotein release transport system permease subunit
MSIVLIGLVTAMTTSERWREVAVLRALGATQATVLKSLLMEGGILALAGGAAAIAIAAFAVFLFRDLIVQLTGVPFLYPSPLSLLGLMLGVLALALISVILASLIPTWRIVHQEPGTAMKEW